MDHRLEQSYWALPIAIGLTALLAGIDKFFNLLANWESYLSPLLTRMLPLSASAFMHVVGVIEIVVGLAILTRYTRAFAYVAMVWLLAIAANLLSTGHYFDVAVRDVVMAIGAFTLARLAEVRAKVPVPEKAAAHAYRPAESRA